MKEYKVYLNDLDYITLTDANNKLKDKGMIKSNIIFYNKIKYEDLYKIRNEISWYLVNQKCLDKINNLQSKIDKVIEYIETNKHFEWHTIRNEKGKLDTAKISTDWVSGNKILDILKEDKYE